MGKVGVCFSGIVALAAVACAAGPTPPTRVAQADVPAATDAPAPSPRLAAAIAAPAEQAEPSESKPEEATPPSLTCTGEISVKDKKVCLPPASFVRKLCDGLYPDVALSLFGKGTPWTRVWMAGDVEAWNASGGRTYRSKLFFDEEVLVLSRHAATGGIVMTGAMASYDVLRSDGTCVSVMEGELTTRRPPQPKPALLPFSRLEESTKRALLAAPKVKASHEAVGKACLGAAEKKTCEKAEKALSQAILDLVRGGAALPEPSRHP